MLFKFLVRTTGKMMTDDGAVEGMMREVARLDTELIKLRNDLTPLLNQFKVSSFSLYLKHLLINL